MNEDKIPFTDVYWVILTFKTISHNKKTSHLSLTCLCFLSAITLNIIWIQLILHYKIEKKSCDFFHAQIIKSNEIIIYRICLPKTVINDRHTCYVE